MLKVGALPDHVAFPALNAFLRSAAASRLAFLLRSVRAKRLLDCLRLTCHQSSSSSPILISNPFPPLATSPVSRHQKRRLSQQEASASFSLCVIIFGIIRLIGNLLTPSALQNRTDFCLMCTLNVDFSSYLGITLFLGDSSDQGLLLSPISRIYFIGTDISSARPPRRVVSQSFQNASRPDPTADTLLSSFIRECELHFIPVHAPSVMPSPCEVVRCLLASSRHSG
ncbi:hypothetical protein CBOM_07735 [Ceraceosorus bombacis]|uniref:Uncharacterized protein n=1 Tax=Ceraceosorus bombacis TaxID=401625 RepID=A0A0P1BHS4_9BASI|nr:hypothetical protein CBOM_07735 [Ceraceosorus bombacis]